MSPNILLEDSQQKAFLLKLHSTKSYRAKCIYTVSACNEHGYDEQRGGRGVLGLIGHKL